MTYSDTGIPSQNGTANIIATYKGRKYTCKICVVADTETEKTDNPILNAADLDTFMEMYDVVIISKEYYQSLSEGKN